MTKTTCDRPTGLYCVYPSDGCRSDGDCPAQSYCLVAEGRASCQPTPAQCQ